MGKSWEWSAERRQLRVLAALDESRTQFYHMSTILIAGMGMFTGAYDLFCISVISKLLGRIYYPGPNGAPGILPINVSAAVNGTALCGTLVGQIFCGWLGDKMGRKKVYGITLLMMVIFSIASGLSFSHTTVSVVTTLCFFRFWLGFGIGGDCPLSATIMSEYANTKTRGAFIAAVFGMQGVAMLSSGVFGMILAKIFEHFCPVPDNLTATATVEPADCLWRIMFMLGAIPALATYYGRMKMPETARYTALVLGNAEKAAKDMTKILNIPESRLKEKPLEPDEHKNLEDLLPETEFNAAAEDGKDKKSDENNYGLFSSQFLRRHGLQLLGTSTTWFLLDIVYYSQQLYQSSVLSEIGWIPPANTMNGLQEVFQISQAQCLLAVFSTVPGYCVTVFLVDRIGRRVIQIQGFLCMFLLLCVLGARYPGPYDLPITHQADLRTFVVLYALIFFFANFGPHTTTFIIPAELFPSRLRTTCHGLSAGAGKAGSIIGAFGILYAMQSRGGTNVVPVNPGYPPGIGLRDTFYVLAAICFLGALLTYLVPNTTNRSLERISEEKVRSCESDDISNHPNLPPSLRVASCDIRRSAVVEFTCSPSCSPTQTQVSSDERGC